MGPFFSLIIMEETSPLRLVYVKHPLVTCGCNVLKIVLMAYKGPFARGISQQSWLERYSNYTLWFERGGTFGEHVKILEKTDLPLFMGWNATEAFTQVLAGNLPEKDWPYEIGQDGVVNPEGNLVLLGDLLSNLTPLYNK